MKPIFEYLQVSPALLSKIELSVAIFLILLLCKLAANRIIRKKIDDPKRKYHLNRIVLYVYSVLIVVLIGHIWISGIQSLTTFLGLASAGLAIALHDTVANIAGWLFIITRKPFKVGDRIQIGTTAGDVIDIRMFEFSLIEIGNWVDADQSTGRIVHVPNSKVLRESLSNYQIGFDHIWNEIPVLITFESNWKKAKKILGRIAREKAEYLSDGAQQQIRQAAEKYLIFYNTLTPIIYTSVRASGVLLTIRYLVKPRKRRSTEQDIWEAILDAFSEAEDIDLAYPTTRLYKNGEKSKNTLPKTDDIC
ncbi:MAG: mechanosensitive ion channel [Kiritimatiellia bacterium]